MGINSFVIEDCSISAPSGWCIEYLADPEVLRVLNPTRHCCYAEHLPLVTYDELFSLAMALEPEAIITLSPAEPI